MGLLSTSKRRALPKKPFGMPAPDAPVLKPELAAKLKTMPGVKKIAAAPKAARRGR